MIYEVPPRDAPLSQGDIIEECPLLYWTAERDQAGALHLQSASSNERVLVVTQACDLANTKTSKVGAMCKQGKSYACPCLRCGLA